jgi:ribonuclease P protein component
MAKFSKREKLCNKKLIDELFTEGKAFLFYPFLITFLITNIPGKYPIQLLLHVSKKVHKKAVKRNFIKRLIRESYRLNKLELYNYLSKCNLNLIISINYIGKEIKCFEIINDKMKELLNLLQYEFKKKSLLQ